MPSFLINMIQTGPSIKTCCLSFMLMLAVREAGVTSWLTCVKRASSQLQEGDAKREAVAAAQQGASGVQAASDMARAGSQGSVDSVDSTADNPTVRCACHAVMHERHLNHSYCHAVVVCLATA